MKTIFDSKWGLLPPWIENDYLVGYITGSFQYSPANQLSFNYFFVRFSQYNK